jgi:hypothetical protein
MNHGCDHSQGGMRDQVEALLKLHTEVATFHSQDGQVVQIYVLSEEDKKHWPRTGPAVFLDQKQSWKVLPVAERIRCPKRGKCVVLYAPIATEGQNYAQAILYLRAKEDEDMSLEDVISQVKARTDVNIDVSNVTSVGGQWSRSVGICVIL